jgi:hypothetical protein
MSPILWTRFKMASLRFWSLRLAIDVADVLTARQTTTNPARSSHLGNQILRVLNGGSQGRHQGCVLLSKECLSHGVARLAHTAHLTVLQQSLHLRVATASTHKRHTQERASLLASRATLAQEARLIAQNTISVDIVVVQSVSLTRIHNEALNGKRIHHTSIRNQVGCGIVSRANRLLVVLLNGAEVISHICQTIDFHLCLF